MNFSSKPINQFIILFGAIVFFVFLSFLPRKPKIDKNELQLRKAVQMVQSASSPQDAMKGVMILRDIVEEDPNNTEAIWYLGQFSIQSGQYEKAINRFEKFVQLTNGEEKVNGIVSLADAHYLSGNLNEALQQLEIAKALTKNNESLKEINDRINLINKN